MVFLPFPIQPIVHVPGIRSVAQMGGINEASMVFSIIFAALALGMVLFNIIALLKHRSMATILTLLTSVILLVNFSLEAVIVSPSSMTINAVFLAMLYWTFTLADIVLTSTLLLVMHQRMHLDRKALLPRWKWIVESVFVGLWTAIMIAATATIAKVDTTSNFGHAVMNSNALIHTALALYVTLAVDLTLTSLYLWWVNYAASGLFTSMTSSLTPLTSLLVTRAGFFGIYHVAYYVNSMHDNFAALHLVFTLITPSINLIIIGGLLAYTVKPVDVVRVDSVDEGDKSV